MSTSTLTAGDVTAVINPAVGGRLTQLRFGRLDLLARCGPRPYEWGCFVMAPYAGRIRDARLAWNGRTHNLPVLDPPHAMHGVVLDRPWDVVSVTDRAIELRCAFDERWPWPGRVVQRIEVRPDGLDASLEVHTDADEMPAWCGWHPWFARNLARGEPLEIDLDAGGMLRRDAAGLPTGAVDPVPPGPWDDCFTEVNWPIVVTWPRAVRLEIDADTDFAVVYTEKSAAVCVEPQTAPPDAVALDRFDIVRRGTPLRARMTWTISKL